MESRVIVEDPTNESSGGGVHSEFSWTHELYKQVNIGHAFFLLQTYLIRASTTVEIKWPLRYFWMKISWVFFGLVKMHILAKCSSIRSRKWLFLIGGNYNDWPRWWELNSLSLCTVHLCRFIGKDGGDTKQCTRDVLRTYRGLPWGML